MQIARGNMAIEACNCISLALVVLFLPSFAYFLIPDKLKVVLTWVGDMFDDVQMNEKVTELCLRLLETAKGCLGANDRYIESTKKSLQL